MIGQYQIIDETPDRGPRERKMSTKQTSRRSGWLHRIPTAIREQGRAISQVGPITMPARYKLRVAENDSYMTAWSQVFVRMMESLAVEEREVPRESCL